MKKFIFYQILSQVLLGLWVIVMQLTIDLGIHIAWLPTYVPKQYIPMVVLFPVPVLLLVHFICLTGWYFSFCALNEPFRKLFKAIVFLQWAIVLVLPLIHFILLAGAVVVWFMSFVPLVQHSRID